MEKQKMDRILDMIQSSEELQRQYKEDKEGTINTLRTWLDAEDKGMELDPFFSEKQALEFNIQQLEHDVKVYQERGLIAEAEMIAKEAVIKRKRLPLIGKESEFPEEIAEIKAMQASLDEEKEALAAWKSEGRTTPIL
jgi:hypothetical protein